MFLGNHYHRVDEKGRIALPAKFRPEFAQGVVLVPDVDNCLKVYPIPLWEKISSEFTPHPLARSRMRRLGRFFFGESTLTELDTQGRIPLPQDQRQRLNIREEVVIVGMKEHLEIWDKESWEKEIAEVRQQAWQLLESSEHEGLQKEDKDR